MSSGASLKGAAQIRAKLVRLQTRFPDEVGRALYQESEVELKEIKRRTPVDTGELRASEHVEGPFRSGRSISTRIVAGGPSASYALYVHENLEAFHAVGQAKYIESVLFESQPYMSARVAKRIDLNRMLVG